MFSTRSRSSRHPPGRQSSRRLQFEQLSWALRDPAGASICVMKIALGLGLSCATTAAMCAPLLSLWLCGALCDHFAHALEFTAFVEEIQRPEPQRIAPIGLGGKVGQHVEIDARLALVHFLQHVEAASAVE